MVAVFISQVETVLGILVLDFEKRVGAFVVVFGLGTHALDLAWREASGEHATFGFACVFGPGLGLFLVVVEFERKTLRHCNFCTGHYGKGDGGGDLHDERVGRKLVVWSFAKCLEMEYV